MTNELVTDEDEVPEAEVVAHVAASEHQLIRLARALVAGPASREDVWSLLAAGEKVPAAIGHTAAGLLADALRQSWRALVLRGGTRPGQALDEHGAIVSGRVWQRHAVVPLAFSPASLALLRWLVTTRFAHTTQDHAPLVARPLAPGDQVLAYLALDAVRATPAIRILAAQPLIRAAPLAWLGFPDLLAREGAAPPSFDSLVRGAGAIVVEMLTAELAGRWATIERAKPGVVQPEAMLALGSTQDAVLVGFMQAANAVQRRDLATFVIDAAAPGLARGDGLVSPAPHALDPAARLGLRGQARLAAGALLRAVRHWAGWDHEHRGVRFFDDEYARAQLLLARFEPIGAAGADLAGRWLDDLAALPTRATLARPS